MDAPQALTWQSPPMHSLTAPSMRPGLVVAASVTDALATAPAAETPQLIFRTPDNASRLHHHARDLPGSQVIAQREDLAGHRTPGRDRLGRLAPASPGGAHADLRVRLGDVLPAQRACTTSTATLPTSTSAATAFATGRAGRRTKPDARARSTNPRFPWKPSAAKLTYRLTGTTEASGLTAANPTRIRASHL